MSQMSFYDFEYAGKRKQQRCERYLAEMKQVVSWSGLVALIELHYPKAGGGRKPVSTGNRTKYTKAPPSNVAPGA